MKARADAATPGEWMAFSSDDALEMMLFGVSTSGDLWHDLPPEKNGSDAVVCITLLSTPRYAVHKSAKWEENANFIAHARADVPRLIAEVERLQEELAMLATKM